MAFDKLYADLVAPDGSAYVVYLATFDFLGHRLRFAELEAFPADGPRRVYTARPSAAHTTTLANAEALDVELATSVGRFRFQSRALNGAFVPRDQPRSGLEWSVCMGRSEARLTLPPALGGGAVAGIGYVDHLHVARPTPRSGLRTLDWGRAHLSTSSIVWTRLRFSDGQAWAQFARWDLPGGPAQPAPLTPSEELAVAQIEAAGGSAEAQRLLHEGSPLDRCRVPAAPLRWLLQAAAGPAHQRRWLTRIVEPRLATNGWGIHEFVSFDRG